MTLVSQTKNSTRPLKIFCRENHKVGHTLRKPGQLTGTIARQLGELNRMRQLQLSRMPPNMDGWDVSGTLLGTEAEMSHGGVYDWSFSEDGALEISAGYAEGTGLSAGLSATSLLTALRAHTYYAHTPRELISSLNRTLWTGSAGDQLASMWYGIMSPTTGKMNFCTAGLVCLMLFDEVELVWDTLTDSISMGLDPDSDFTEHEIRISAGQRLVVLASGFRSQSVSMLQQFRDGVHDERLSKRELTRFLAATLEEKSSRVLQGMSLVVIDHNLS